MKEIRRILKPRGIAVITATGQMAISYRHDVRKQAGRIDVSNKELGSECKTSTSYKGNLRRTRDK